MVTLRFDPERGHWLPESIHPPHNAAAVGERTGFELVGLDGTPATLAPTAEEVRLLREVVRSRMIETDTYGEWARTTLGAA